MTKGCPAAVWKDGSPSEKYCKVDRNRFDMSFIKPVSNYLWFKGQSHDGKNGTYPWWSYCCYWQGDSRTCKPKGERKNWNFMRIWAILWAKNHKNDAKLWGHSSEKLLPYRDHSIVKENWGFSLLPKSSLLLFCLKEKAISCWI